MRDLLRTSTVLYMAPCARFSSGLRAQIRGESLEGVFAHELYKGGFGFVNDFLFSFSSSTPTPPPLTLEKIKKKEELFSESRISTFLNLFIYYGKKKLSCILKLGALVRSIG